MLFVFRLAHPIRSRERKLHVDQPIPQIDLLSDERHDWDVLGTVASELQVPLRIYQSLDSYPAQLRTRSWVVSKIKLPDGNACDLMRRLRSAARAVPVVFLRDTEPMAEIVQIMKWGAQIVLQKPLRAAEMLQIMRDSVPEIEASGELVEATLEAHRKIETLDDEEHRVLEAATLGLPNKAAAMRLGIALRTLERRRYLLMKKLGVNSAEELVVLAIRRQYAAWVMPQNAGVTPDLETALPLLRMA